MAKWFEDPARNIAESLKFYTSPIDPKTRKGGGYSRKEAIKMTKKETIYGPKIWKRAFKMLGWE